MKEIFVYFLILLNLNCLATAITTRISYNYFSVKKYKCNDFGIRAFNEPTDKGNNLFLLGILADLGIYRYLFLMGGKIITQYALITFLPSFLLTNHLDREEDVDPKELNLNGWRGSCENNFKEPYDYFYASYFNEGKASNPKDDENLLKKNTEIAIKKIYLDLLKESFDIKDLSKINQNKYSKVLEKELGYPKLFSCRGASLQGADLEHRIMRNNCIYYLSIGGGKDSVKRIVADQK